MQIYRTDVTVLPYVYTSKVPRYNSIGRVPADGLSIRSELLRLLTIINLVYIVYNLNPPL